MKPITLTIDGREVAGQLGQTVLEVARANGVFVPTLCHDDKLEPFGSCYLCVVEVKGARRLMPACATKAAAGMVVLTETEAIRANRRMCLELLLSDHRGDCLGPCARECPGGLDPQGYIAHAAAGRWNEALQLIKSVLPLPAAIGRVCPRPCEQKCRRNVLGEPVAIDAIKRSVADRDLFTDEPWRPELAPSSGKRVAVVGAGPAGLTAAYFLKVRGHQPVIFEQMPKPGGMLRYGIPAYRLPHDVLDQEIATITRLGVEVRYGQTLGATVTVDGLRKEFDAVLLAVGAWKVQEMRCEGEELPGVWGGIDFLRAVVEGRDVGAGAHVAVIGGGNTAIDAARTAWRLGSKVTLLYRRTRAEMPAHPEEIDAALHEGVEIRYLVAPTRIRKSGEGLAVECIRMSLGASDASGRRRPEPVAGSEFTVEATSVVSAIGQKVDLGWAKATPALQQTKWGSLQAEEGTGATPVPGVFAAGDCATGADIAIKAIGGARRAAEAVDRYLRGEAKAAPARLAYDHTRGANEDLTPERDYPGVERTPRERLPELSLERRRGTFDEVEHTYPLERLQREAARCLACGCQDADECDLRDHAARYGAVQDRFTGDHCLGATDLTHPFVLREQQKCIKCARCVRVCLEVQGVGAWGFVERGFGATVEPTYGRPLADTDCESCGQCVATCPTGALQERVPGPQPGPFRLQTADSFCTECGLGCAVRLAGVGGHLLKVLPRPGSAGGGNLCQRGRFDRVFGLADRTPLAAPMVFGRYGVVRASWDEALERAASVLREAGDQVAVFVAPTCTNEEAYAASRFARTGLGTNNVGSLAWADGRGFLRALPGELAPEGYGALGEADLVVLVDPGTVEQNGVIGNLVLAATRRGVPLVVVGEAKSKLDAVAAIKIEIPEEEIGTALRAVLESVAGDDEAVPGLLSDERTVLLELLAQAERVVLVTNRDRRPVAELALLAALRSALQRRGGRATVVTLRSHANGLGLVLAGVDPFFLPGPVALGSSEESRLRREWGAVPQRTGACPAELLASGALAGALLVGEDPLGDPTLSDGLKEALGRVPLVVLDSHLSRTARSAAAVLPCPGRHEVAGGLTNSEGRVQRLGPLAPSRVGRPVEASLADLARALGGPVADGDQLASEMARLVPGW